MVGCGKPEVGKFDCHSFVCYQDVLRLQIPVVDSNGVTIFNGIKDLEKSSPGKSVITNVFPAFGYVGKEVTLRTVLDNNVGAIWRVHDFYQGDDIGMSTGLVVELDFPLLEFPLSWL